MKLIAVSQRVEIIHERNEVRDSLDHLLVKYLLNIGYFTVPIPNNFDCQSTLNKDNKHNIILKDWLELISPAGIILSGGNNIGESSKRDKTEMQLLDLAAKLKLPILGICRGMQIMAKWSGMKIKSVNGHINTRHKLSGLISSEVNSYHKYSLSNCPTNFETIATSSDGEIEAIRHKSLPWEGWMWHPEREPNIEKNQLIRVKQIFK